MNPRSFLPKFEKDTDWLFLVLAAAVGAVGALANAAFRGSIGLMRSLFLERGADLHVGGLALGPILIVVAPTVGGLLVTLIGRISGRDVFGYGLPSFLEVVNLRGAVLSIRGILWRTVAAVVTLGSGGSAGVEGPVAALGGAVGAGVARTGRMVGEKLKLLVACGSTAAIAAAYGAPMTGVFFTQEIVLAGNYDLHNFVRVVVASGTATVVARAIHGDAPTFDVEAFKLHSGAELLVYLALGGMCGLLGPLLQRMLYSVRDRFRGSRLPEWIRPALGGLTVGLIALLFPGVLGDGADFMQQLFHFDQSPALAGCLLLFGMIAAKILATSMTLGSGGTGGVLGPSIFLGATCGAALGSAANLIAPGLIGTPGHYAVVGMGAFLAATTRAPLTAIFLVFEMTGSSSTAVFPTLLAVAVALYIARRIEPHSIDEVDLVRRGVHLAGGREALTLSSRTVSQAMSTNVDRLRFDTPVAALPPLLHSSRASAFVVEDGLGAMIGLLCTPDLRMLQANAEGVPQTASVAGDVAVREVVTVFPDDSLAEGLGRLDRYGFRQIPVVERNNPLRVVGMLERRHVLSAYNRAL